MPSHQDWTVLGVFGVNLGHNQPNVPLFVSSTAFLNKSLSSHISSFTTNVE